MAFCSWRVDSFLKKRMRKTAAEGFKNFAADGICLQIVADAKYAGDRRRAPQEGAALLDAATLRKVSCVAGAGQRGKARVKHEDTSEGCIEVRPSVPSGSVDRRADHITKTRKITDDSQTMDKFAKSQKIHALEAVIQIEKCEKMMRGKKKCLRRCRFLRN